MASRLGDISGTIDTALSPIEKFIEWILFASRWIVAMFYIGLISALVGLLVTFGIEWMTIFTRDGLEPFAKTVMWTLSLIDIVLVANLVLIVVLAGYENFVSKITPPHVDRPGWMSFTDFSDVKLKLFSSIVAITGIQLLKVYMSYSTNGKLTAGSARPEDVFPWMIGIHLTFVVTTLLSALSDRASAHGSKTTKAN